jgi:DNA-binding MarR family transcriptional regulator
MDDEFAQCLVLNVRMAARAVTRRYDRQLRPFGVSAAQFSILTSIARRPDRSVTEMAQSIAMERSTLSRNMDLLERKGLVLCQGAEKGNGRMCSLTEAGKTLVGELVPEWRRVQAEMRELLHTPDMGSIVDVLAKLASLEMK